jgi:hypothetical protein
VVRVESGGCVVRCEKTPPPRDPLTKNGGSVSTPLAISEASGTIFVRGIQGLADGEKVNVKAMKTEEMFNYRGTTGAIRTLRIYQVAN